MEKADLAAACTVGVFDSGIGGLNLLAECAKKMSWVDFIYFADNHAVPYGGRSESDILARVREKFNLMREIGVTAAVLACNTATAVCIGELRREFSFPIIGIQPAVKTAAASGLSSAVLCTEATAGSRSLKTLINTYGGGRCRAVPCPDLAPYIEARAPYFEYEEVVRLLPSVSAECVVLGCTHYSYVKNAIKIRYGLPIFDGLVGTADHLKTFLGNCDHFSNYEGKIHFVGGDICKNSVILQHLMKNYNG